MSVREFVESDSQAVSLLWQRVFGYPEARNAPERVLQAKLGWDGRLLVFEREGKLLGTLMVGYDGHRGWLYRLAVAPEHRRRGVARALVERAESVLAELGCTKVNLQLHGENQSGVRFWEALGYAQEVRVSMGKDLTGEIQGRDAGC